MSNSTDLRLVGKHLYFGNLPTDERQYLSGNFVGLALRPTHDREIRHDAREPLPVGDSSVLKAQSQDVFEHLPYETLPEILSDVFRVLVPGGVFRLSLPDYNSPFLLKRCVFDECGNILGDLRMGASVRFEKGKRSRIVEFKGGGNAHLWFPTFALVRSAVDRSRIRESSQIVFRQGFTSRDAFKCDPIPDEEMYVKRALPHDRRANGAPVSLVFDFFK
ncbi:MAG: hypothetical protein KIS73_13680 [Enhydrobacter sp.]|nr:hypothetical protein [Enhydrobacter sp.]